MANNMLDSRPGLTLVRPVAPAGQPSRFAHFPDI